MSRQDLRLGRRAEAVARQRSKKSKALNIYGGDHGSLSGLGDNDHTQYARKVEDFVCDKAANGYTYLPNGLIIQWGVVTNVPAAGNKTINLPLAFPNAALQAVVSRKQDGNAANSCYLGSLTLTQIKVWNSHATNAYDATFWAVGY